jgi:tetratricopeptide (TPR) repeat protein
MAEQETADAGGPSDGTRFVLQRLYTLLGRAEGRVRDAGASERHHDKARAIAAERLKAHPEDGERKRWLAVEHERIGDVLLRANRPGEAAKQYASAAALFTAVAASDPKNVDAQADLSRILYSQGLAAVRTGDPVAAAANFQGSLGIRKDRVNLDTETYARRDLMMSLARVGSHSEAVELAESVRAKLPKDPGALVDVANCYAVCSAVVPAAGADKEARERYVAKALEALGQALDAGYGDKVNLETEPDLDAIRDRAEFKALLDRVPEP